MTKSKLQTPLNRREALIAAGALGTSAGALALLRNLGPAEAQAASCILTPELTEGPYYIDDSLVRRDIREGKKGVILDLRLTVVDASSCKPIKGALVEIWHADAAGVYSGFGSGASSKTFLRGGQKTDAKGLAKFRTIYPGWYQGRTPHIHIKTHVSGDEVHTGQLFFKESVSKAVYGTSRYSRGTQDTTNSEDSIYAQGGSKSLLRPKKSSVGYTASLVMGVDA